MRISERTCRTCSPTRKVLIPRVLLECSIGICLTPVAKGCNGRWRLGEANNISGGCQCGAVRYTIEQLGGAAICHCRMCQKQFGSFYGPLVTANGVVWTKGGPRYFVSSNMARRGFCADCGTPLCYDAGGEVEIAIGSLDNPEQAPPTMQIHTGSKLSFTDGLTRLPIRQGADASESQAFQASLASNQHPDHDT
ncbi:MAG: GFA family protein [Alphaproteobacteria bacterium]|nr:GFA family protein [Alphaproteobacteria bacterium]MDE2340031.1 GFA family protein [Alphaproteobacteria bacterium]